MFEIGGIDAVGLAIIIDCTTIISHILVKLAKNKLTATGAGIGVVIHRATAVGRCVTDKLTIHHNRTAVAALIAVVIHGTAIKSGVTFKCYIHQLRTAFAIIVRVVKHGTTTAGVGLVVKKPNIAQVRVTGTVRARTITKQAGTTVIGKIKTAYTAVAVMNF